MARIRSFTGYRYTLGGELSAVVAPPYDVISDEHRARLLSRDGRNAVALELPDGVLDPDVPGNRYATGEATWNHWREQGILAPDPQPAIYVLEQRFEISDSPVRRRAFIVEVQLEPFSAGVVLPHERTLPKALGDRFELIKSTKANLSQVFGLFDDAAHASDAIFDAATSADPVAWATDEDGVESRLWASTELGPANSLARLLAEGRIFIADGHHRYTTALAYRDLRRRQTGVTDGAPGAAPYDFVMMALVNMDDPELVVLPTHRVVDAEYAFDAGAFSAALSQHFIIEELDSGHPAGSLDGISAPAFLFKTSEDERVRRARLRPDLDIEAVIPLDRSAAWKSLDVAVLQELVLGPLLGVHPDRPETLERLRFPKDADEAFAATAEHDVAFVLRATRMDQLRSVALAGETMPQKSTYFYPKLLSGLVFRSAE
jgi:uncharacterized protein (DUF1015 family)